MNEYENNATVENEVEEQAMEPTTSVNVTVTEEKKSTGIGKKILRGAEAGLAAVGAVYLFRQIRDNIRRRRELHAELKQKLKEAKEAPNITEGSAENK